MNTELFIAKRVFGGNRQNKSIASKIVSIAVGSIALGLAIMIISVAVLLGFQKEVREKVIGFGAHFQVVNYDSNFSYETSPVKTDLLLISEFQKIPEITHLQIFATKPGIIKTDKEIHGMVLKGVDRNYNWHFFEKNLLEGTLPKVGGSEPSLEVLISEKIARLLQLKTGDRIFSYFYNEGESTPRPRRFLISGIYRTSLEEFDELFVLGDIQQVQQLNGWTLSEVSGYELYIGNFEDLDKIFATLKTICMNHASENNFLRVHSIVSKYPMLFDWLAVLDMNVWVLLFLMLAVAGINMISGLFIIIIERTRMIGVLKAMGYPDFSIRKVFLYLCAMLAGKGLFWGNIIGLSLSLLQYTSGIITLDPENYYLDTVPIFFHGGYFILLNIGTILSVLLMIIVPSMYISKISPVEAISFE